MKQKLGFRFAGAALVAMMAFALALAGCAGDPADPRVDGLTSQVNALQSQVAALEAKDSIDDDALQAAIDELDIDDYVSAEALESAMSEFEEDDDDVDAAMIRDAVEDVVDDLQAQVDDLESKNSVDAATFEAAVDELNLQDRVNAAMLEEALAELAHLAEHEDEYEEDAIGADEVVSLIAELRIDIEEAGGEELDAFDERVRWLERAVGPSFTTHYVETAVRRYQSEGRAETLAYYNTQDSVEGDYYLFVLDGNFRVIVHPTVPANIGMDIRGPLGTDITGKNFGAEMVTVDESGKWVDYVYINPADDSKYERKHTWLVKHEGLIFASGWYERDVSLKDNPRVYARALVGQAIARYDADGRDDAIAYYNRPESVDGQWYVFIVGEDDNFLAHAATPARVGTDVKVLKDANGYAHGQAISEATERGGWLEYTRVNPATGDNAPKHSWVIRHDGVVFGAGYYEDVAGSPAAAAKEYVNDALARYESDGREDALAYYNTRDSVDGDLYLFVIDENDEIIVHPTVPTNIGESLTGPMGIDITGKNFGAEMVAADESGGWVDYVYLNPADDYKYERKHSWVVKRDGLVFGAGWYERDVSLKGNPRVYARALVGQAIARYDADGADDTIAHYNRPESVDGQWYVFIVGEDDNFLAHAATPARVGTDVKVLKDANGYAHGQAISEATEEGGWLEYTRVNPATGDNAPKHSWVIRHDGVIFGAGYYEE